MWNSSRSFKLKAVAAAFPCPRLLGVLLSLPRCSGKPQEISNTLTHLDSYRILTHALGCSMFSVFSPVRSAFPLATKPAALPTPSPAQS